MAIFRRDTAKTPPAASREETASGPFYKAPDWQPRNPAAADAPAVRAKSDRPQTRGTDKRSLVAPGTRFQGTLSGPAELVIEGEVEGLVKPDNHLEVGRNGKIVGDVSVRTARIAGQVVGNVVGREIVEITATGRLEGDVIAPRVVISEGAFFRGNVTMTGRDRDPGALDSSPGSATHNKVRA